MKLNVLDNYVIYVRLIIVSVRLPQAVDVVWVAYQLGEARS